MSTAEAPAISGVRKIYVASSWRNLAQPAVVQALRSMGHEVYDFRNPAEGNDGFHWSEIDGGWQQWTNERYIEALNHPVAEAGFKSDFDAMQWADTFVLVQPCGRSAHLEMGWAVGAGKTTVMLLGEQVEPELMAKMCDHICPTLGDVLNLFPITGPWGVYDVDGAGEEWYLARSEAEAIAAANERWQGGDIEYAEEVSEKGLDRMQFHDADGTKRSFREELARRVADNPEPSIFASSDY